MNDISLRTIGRETLIMRRNSDKLYESVGLCKSDTPELVKKATYDADMLFNNGTISNDMHKNYLNQLDYLTTEFKKFCIFTRRTSKKS